MAEIKVFTDLNLKFKPHPLTGNVPTLVNIDAIRQSVLTVFLLEPFDIPFNPDTHANLRRYLFEPLTRTTIASIKAFIENKLEKIDSRIVVNNVEIVPLDQENGFDIKITYKIKAFNLTDTVTKFFRRVR